LVEKEIIMRASIISPLSAASGRGNVTFVLDVPGRSKKPAKEMDYVLGHSQREIRRLMTQAAILRPVTERLLRNVKIAPGMRVLDLGCGAGDVSMLVAESVGPTGLVVGIDRNQEVLALAGERARAAGLRQVSFEQASVEEFFVP
jgi:2-polyprenyl-3-methyl-5-hydroxy-6-metoxy-1,4-benzoquinol methylase